MEPLKGCRGTLITGRATCTWFNTRCIQACVQQWKDGSQSVRGAGFSFKPEDPPSSIGAPACEGSTRSP
eukprot:11100023-Prorocentrum_lima.AAC.1